MGWFDAYERFTNARVTRDQARAIEQAIKDANQFENEINTISASRTWYEEAMLWADKWLANKGRVN